jgi:hypothetical protein
VKQRLLAFEGFKTFIKRLNPRAGRDLDLDLDLARMASLDLDLGGRDQIMLRSRNF